jgi:hypothetical protein
MQRACLGSMGSKRGMARQRDNFDRRRGDIGEFYSSGGWESDGPGRMNDDGGADSML